MKQDLKIGNVVDDGTGDYLRKGGQKINDNFDELYYQLGDGSFPHAAGAWKTHKSVDATIIEADWGKSYAIDTAVARVTLKLPKGTTNDYNKVIRARDVFATWSKNPVTLVAASGDTLKGSATPKEINIQYADLELVYCPPGRWEYVENKQVNKITSEDLAAVVRKEYLITVQDQTDFLDVFDGYEYNKTNIEVFHRGNILYYGTTFSNDSDYGSPGAAPGQLVELNGRDIRLRQKCNVGDTVIIISYMDGVTQWRSSYNRRQIILLDETKTATKSVPGAYFVGDIKNTKKFTTDMFGLTLHEPINPNSLEVEFNGITQAPSGTLNIPYSYCEGADADNQEGCELLGGVWSTEPMDYSTELDENDRITAIVTGRDMEHGDIITLTWYNNNIGTTMSLDEIIDETSNLYISQGNPLPITGSVRITDENNPAAPNIEPVPAFDMTINTPRALFDVFHPVGSVYTNAVNPNNPATYMGMGRWVLWGKGLVTVGWNNDAADGDFHLNNNDLDVNGNPSQTAGGTTGTRSTELTNDNLPSTKTDDKVLVVDDNGPVVVGGCQFDPEEGGTAYTKYREDYATTNKTHISPTTINNIQPSITVYRWLRIE